jgi:hypothetical protein
MQDIVYRDRYCARSPCEAVSVVFDRVGHVGGCPATIERGEVVGGAKRTGRRTLRYMQATT